LTLPAAPNQFTSTNRLKPFFHQRFKTN